MSTNASPASEPRRGPRIDPSQFEHFLRVLDPNAKWLTFQTFTDREQKPQPDPFAKVFNASRFTRGLLDLYEQGAGAWVTINDTEGNGRKASAVTRVRAVWQEDDDGFEGEFPLEPSLVVETSPGHFHRYWLVSGDWPADEQGRKDFAGVMACMVAAYGSDKGAKDISRVLRVPGFLHRKNPAEPHMVRIVGGNRRRYTRAQIMEAFPPPEKTAAPRGNGHAGGSDSESHAELVRQVLAGENYHGALTQLAWRHIGARMPAGQVVEHLRGLMRSIPDERRDERWHARFAEIPRLVSSAEGKRSSNGAAEQAGSDKTWPDPVPLPCSLLEVAPFDYGMLPEKLRPWVEDVSERMQCPPDYVAVTVMVGLAITIGRKVAMRPKLADDWSVVPNMWGLCIGPPGIMKSPAQSEGLRPLKMLATAAREAFNMAKAEYEIKAAAAKARTENNKKEVAKALAKNSKATIDDLLKPQLPDGEEPTCKRYITTNTSVEALGEVLQQNPNGIGVDRDEALSLLERLDEEGRADERGFYLSGWNGDTPYTFDRIGRGLDLHIPAVCISIIGGTQPARISQYLAQVKRGARGNDGLIQRFGLMVWPDIIPTWTNVDRKPNREARDAACRVFEQLDQLDWRLIGARRDRGLGGDEEGLPFLRPSEDAHSLFVAWRTELEHRLRRSELDPMLESHLAKYRKLIPGIALTVRLADTHHLGDAGAGTVGLVAVEKALKWAAYLETHAARTYASTTIAATDASRAIIAKVNSGHLKEQFGSREIVRAQWSMLRDRETIHAALQLLVDHDWLEVITKETGGRRATVYSVNPKALSQGNTHQGGT